MSLSDIMSAADLVTWAELALVISFLAFLSVVILVFLRGRDRAWERARYLPLEGSEPFVSASTPGPMASKDSGARASGSMTVPTITRLEEDLP